MKKTLIIFMTLAAALSLSCTKQEADIPAEGSGYNTVLTAKIPGTKVTIDDNYTKLTWNNGDRISVLTSSGEYREFVYEGQDGATSAEFKGNLLNGETLAGWAVYPADERHGVTDGKPAVYLPAEYEWKEGQVMGPMTAEIADGEASFTHAGGLFAFDVQNMPAGATGFRFAAADMTINGEDGSTVDMTFEGLAEPEDMRFHIPVPTGSYKGFTISYRNSENEFVDIRTATSTNVIDYATVKVFSVAIEGGAWYVTESGTAEADGLSWANSTTLSNALAKATEGDVIYVGAGTYVPDTFISGQVATENDDKTITVADDVTTATGDAQKAFIIDKNVTVLGGYPVAGGNICNPVTNKTVLSGNDITNHVVLVSAPKSTGKSVKMSGFTISGASSNKTDDAGKWQINETLLDDYSGAMAVVGTSLSLKDMTFTGNNTVNASAIYGANSTVSIKNCSFTDNTASGNGTVWFADGSELTFADSEISGNNAANGAGLYLYLTDDAAMTANVSNLTITGNTATTRGGAMYLRTETAGQILNAVFNECAMEGNTSAAGASIYILNASGMTVKNCEIYDNDGTGSSEGGAFYSLDAGNTFIGCSFTSNTASGNGTFLLQSNAVPATNIFDRCNWCENSTTGFANVYVYGKATDNNVVITNSLFKGNSVTGRGGAIYARATGVGKVDCKCINTTFHGNKATAAGTAILSYSNNDSFVTNIDLISCTITANENTTNKYAVTAETAKGKGNAAVTLQNTIIANNIYDTNHKYDVGKIENGVISRKFCQNGTTYYDGNGASTSNNGFDYTTMLGALNADGVCPLLLPESNPAYTGGMTAAELSALASTHVLASVLTSDQLGNERTGKIIGAWSGTY